jgi:hypothetical protein
MKYGFITIAFTCVLLIGCGGAKESLTNSVSRDPVKTSGSKPDWVSDDRTYWIEDGRFRFRVMSDNEPDLSFAEGGLMGKAYIQLTNAIKVRAGFEFDEATKGSKYSENSIGQARQSVVNAMGDVKFSDLVKEREYWEQYERRAGVDRVSYIHTIYGLYSISEIELTRAKEAAWNAAKANVERQADKEAKQLLDEAKSRFLGRE